jgi:hypothetical protein
MRVIEHKPPVPVWIGDEKKAVFLAGPIQGAPNWQSNAIEIFTELPGRIGELHALNPRREGQFNPDDYKDQVFWEQDNIVRAIRQGVVLFWLQAKDDSIAYPEGREYAKTTKKELGMAVGQLLLGNAVDIAFGIDPELEDQERYFRTTFGRLGLPVHTSLGTTCEDAWLKLHR